MKNTFTFTLTFTLALAAGQPLEVERIGLEAPVHGPQDADGPLAGDAETAAELFHGGTGGGDQGHQGPQSLAPSGYRSGDPSAPW